MLFKNTKIYFIFYMLLLEVVDLKMIIQDIFYFKFKIKMSLILRIFQVKRVKITLLSIKNTLY